MNEYIEVVKKWLSDKDSVSKGELAANYVNAANADDADDAAANAAYYAHAYAADYAEYAADKSAADWVDIYEELTDDH